MSLSAPLHRRARSPIVILGAGAGSGELIALVRHAAFRWPLLGILDDDLAKERTQCYGLPVIGRLDDAARFPRARFISGIANARSPDIRLRIAARLDLPEQRWVSFVHPAAVVVPGATIGAGSIVYPGAVISANARIAPHCAVYYNAVVHHDSVVGAGCCVCASVTIAGASRIGDGCYIGMGALVRDHVDIGAGSLIGMGSVVVKDIPPGSRVAGVPARPFAGRHGRPE